MYLTATVLLAVLVALARGGKWNNLIKFTFKKSWIVIIAISLQLLIFNPVWDKLIKIDIITNLLYIVSILLLLSFILINMSIYGLKILGLGVVLNATAIIANGGYMPSSLEALKRIMPPERINELESGMASYNIVLITDDTRLKFLCDIFYVPHINVYSVGDILIALGVFITIQQIMLGRFQNYIMKGG